MCSAHLLMVLYIGVKFREKISIAIRVMEWTLNYEALIDRQMNRCKDRQMDTQKFGRYNIIPHHFLWWGIQCSEI